jgi:hypothetical protein
MGVGSGLTVDHRLDDYLNWIWRLLLVLVGRNYELCSVFPAHPIDRSSGTRANRIGVASGLFRHYGHRPVGAAHDHTARIKRRRIPKIEDESRILRFAGESNCGACLHAEGRVRFAAWNHRGGRRGIAPVPSNIHLARRRGRAAGICGATEALRISGRAHVVLRLLLLATMHKSGQHNRGDENPADHK